MRASALLHLCLLGIMLSSCGTITASTPSGPTVTIGTLQISGVWARATVGASNADSTATSTLDPSDAVGAAYMTIHNTGDTPDRLLEIQGDVAQSIELHSMEMDSNVMKMRPITGIDVPANSEIAFKPGGSHVMLIGLKHDLKAGDMVTLKLVFEKVGEVSVQAEVRP